MIAFLLAALALLLMLCATLVFLLIGRDRGARREEARLHRIAAGYRREVVRLSAANGQLARKVTHLQERNADLRDELDIATGATEPSLVAEWTAALADITPEDFR